MGQAPDFTGVDDAAREAVQSGEIPGIVVLVGIVMLLCKQVKTSVKLPMSSPRSEITSRTPLGAAMNRIPTTAKLSASARRLSTTNRSARAPVTAADANPLRPGRAEGARAAGPRITL